MIDIQKGATVKCADCGEDSVVEFIGNYKGNPGYSLSCQHRNGYCRKCNLLARDVSDASKEVYIFCDNCFDYSDIFDPPEITAISSKFNKKLKWKKPAAAYPLDDLRKINLRAYNKWTEDESIALSLYIDRKNPQELSSLFNRDLSAITQSRSIESKKPIPDSSAVRFLGTKIKCNSCSYETILSYQHLELIAEKLSVGVLNLHLGNITRIADLFRCKECGSKGATFLL